MAWGQGAAGVMTLGRGCVRSGPVGRPSVAPREPDGAPMGGRYESGGNELQSSDEGGELVSGAFLEHRSAELGEAFHCLGEGGEVVGLEHCGGLWVQDAGGGQARLHVLQHQWVDVGVDEAGMGAYRRASSWTASVAGRPQPMSRNR